MFKYIKVASLFCTSVGMWTLFSCATRYDPPLSFLIQPRATQKILILGDSLTEYSRGFYVNEYLGSQYLVEYKGAPNKDIPYWSTRISQALSTDGNPYDMIVFPMGTNDAYSYTSEIFISQVHDFHRLLRSASSATIFYCKVPRTKDVIASQILGNNQKLQDNLPSDFTDLIDLDFAFESFSGVELLYPLTDPIHPTQAGYRLIGRTISFAIESRPF